MYSTILCKKFSPGPATIICDQLSRSLYTDCAIGVLSKCALGASCARSFHTGAAVRSDGRPLTFLRPKADRATCTTFISERHYCKDYRPFPRVPDFPPVVWPNPFKSFKALLYSYLIIKPQFDHDFSLGEFSKNSRKAVEVVSKCIANQDFSTLQGLVTNDVLEQVKSIVSNLNEEEVKSMGFDNDDLYLYLPIQLDIINDVKIENRRFVEITMCYHAIHNLEEIKKRSEEIVDIQKELKSSIYVLNYRFIREYTEGVKDAWTVNAINHLKAEEQDKTIF